MGELVISILANQYDIRAISFYHEVFFSHDMYSPPNMELSLSVYRACNDVLVVIEITATVISCDLIRPFM